MLLEDSPLLSETRRPGDFYSQTRLQRQVAGFLVTEGLYAPSLEIGTHDHELASLCFVMAGRYEERFGRRTRSAEPGMVIVHPAGERHANRHGPEPVRLLTIEIGAERLERLRPATGALDEAWHRTDTGFSALATRLRDEARNTDPVSALALESVLLDMLARVARSGPAEATRAAWLLRVRDYLEAHVGEGPSTEHLARIAGVHPVHLARAFRRGFGCSIGGYARRLQVARALALLEDATLSLSAVALEAGFSDQSHMTRLVRAQTGKTPGRWRRERG